MSISSSSASEDISHFKEAVDIQFLPDDIYSRKNTSPQTLVVKKSLPSLRPSKTEDNSNNPFNVKVTPAFQQYVSQHLSKILENEIVYTTRNKSVGKFTSLPKHGVKLLRTSHKYLKAHEHYFKHIKVKRPHLKRRKVDIDSSDEDEVKAKKVAVTGQWVLSQQETKHWAPCTKGEVIVVQSPVKKKKKKKKKKQPAVIQKQVAA